MLRTALIGLAAALALTAGATQASAKTNWDINVHFGAPGFYGPVYSPYHSIYYDDEDCHYVTKKKLVKVGGGFWKKKYVKVLVCH
jgi:hypothetical protein